MTAKFQMHGEYSNIDHTYGTIKPFCYQPESSLFDEDELKQMCGSLPPLVPQTISNTYQCIMVRFWYATVRFCTGNNDRYDRKCG